MKKFFVYIMLSCLSLSFAQDVNASSTMNAAKEQKSSKKEKKDKKAKSEDESISGKVAGKVYVFACSFEFGDSLVYISSIQEVDSIALTNKTKFLPYRYDFSQQFKDKLESKAFAAKNQTASVFFAEKKATLQKTYDKIRKRYLTKQDVMIVNVKEEDFKFVHPLDYYGLVSE